MSKYTITIQELIKCQYKFALDSYPIFDEEYRNVLNKKILDHYLFYEIGQETPDRFNHYLRTKMSEIMPYYNQLYKSELLDIDPFLSYNEDVTKTKKSNINQSTYNTHSENENTAGKNDSTINTTNNETLGGSDSETIKHTENETQNKTGTGNQTQLTTNDLNTTSDTTSQGNGENITKGSKQNIFSDTPPNQITTITHPDGTIESTSYATTTNNDTTTENAKTDTTESSHGTVDNTGTVSQNQDVSNREDLTTESTYDDNKTLNYGKTNDSTSKQTKYENGTTNKDLTGESNSTQAQTYDEGASENKKGFNIPLADLLIKYRETFLNIDMLIIEELSPLFMGIW